MDLTIMSLLPEAFAVSVAWLAVVCSGMFLLKVAEDRWTAEPFSDDFFVKLLASTALGFASFVPFMLVGYLFALPVLVVAVPWAGFLTFGLWWAIIKTNQLKQMSYWISRVKVSWFFVAALILSYGLTMVVGGYLSGDGWGHIARINDIINNGFMIRDPYHPGLFDSRSLINLVHGISAGIASILKISAIDFWFVSLAFFRVMFFVAIYSVARLLTEDRRASSLMATTAVVALSYSLRFVQYPNKVATLWLIFSAFVIVKFLKDPKDKFNRTLVAVTAVLAALTHPLFAVSIGLFMLLVVIISALLEHELKIFANARLILKRYNWLFWSLPLFIAPAIIGTTFARGARGGAQTGLSLEPGEIELLGFQVLDPAEAYVTVFFLALFVLLALTYYRPRSRAITATILAALLVYPLVAFTPVYTFLLDPQIHPGLVERIRSDSNFMQLLLNSATATVGAAVLFINKTRFRGSAKTVFLVLTTGLVCYLTLGNTRDFLYKHGPLNNANYTSFKHLVDSVNSKELSGKKLVVANNHVSYWLPAEYNVQVVDIRDGHATSAVVNYIRNKCNEDLLSTNQSIRQGAILALKPDLFVLNHNDSRDEPVDAPELVPVDSVETKSSYQLYKVNFLEIDENRAATSNACEAVASGAA